EPEHEWCYYSAKAELAQQQGDYQGVVSLGNEAIELGFSPEDPTEWLVFIEGFARIGDLQTAQNLSNTILEEDSRIRRGVCTVWEQIQAKSQVRSAEEIEAIILSLSCNP
ncbi:MAG: hypothetical protein JNM46_07275, partial [Anaerolineales bacterium]|nr:hypothetical protein [Anaerolineales bacterium]